jgi:hypothetical protein
VRLAVFPTTTTSSHQSLYYSKYVVWTEASFTTQHEIIFKTTIIQYCLVPTLCRPFFCRVCLVDLFPRLRNLYLLFLMTTRFISKRNKNKRHTSI